MSTTVELVRANERYARLRGAVEQLAADWEYDDIPITADDLRALLAAVDS